MGIHATFTLANRAEIEAEIERLIALLDSADGDPDLEDDDHAGDPLELHGEAEDWRPEGYALLPPRYGIDQSRGPVNERETDRDWHRHQMAK